MSGTSSGAQQTMIPPTLEWIVDGKPTGAFYALMLSLFNRTGGENAPGGGSSGSTGIKFLQHEIDSLTTDLQSVAQTAAMGTLMSDDGAVAPAKQPSDNNGVLLALLGDNSPPPGIDQAALLGLMLGDSGLGESAGPTPPPSSSGVWAPLTNGDLPGPTLMATPDGQCIMVPIA